MSWFTKIAQVEEKKVVAAVVIVYNGYYLILQRGSTAPWMPNYWNLPGGMSEPGETNPMEVASRETQEETGIPVSGLTQVHSENIEGYQTYFYKAIINNQVAVNLSWENTAYKWITKQQISQYQMVPGVAQAISKS